jgi:hypothetical protein
VIPETQRLCFFFIFPCYWIHIFHDRNTGPIDVRFNGQDA